MEGRVTVQLLYAAKHPRLREVVNPTYYPIFRSVLSFHVLRNSTVANHTTLVWR